MAFVYVKTVPWWADQLLPHLLMEQFDNLYTQCRHIEHMYEGVWFTKIIIDKMAAMSTLTFQACFNKKGLCLFYDSAYMGRSTQLWELRHFFRIVLQRGYAFSIIEHTRADQLLSQLLIEHFNTLSTQCRHIEHMHEGVWLPKHYYWQNGSYEYFDISGFFQQKGVMLVLW